MEITQEQLKKILHYDPETGIFRWRLGGTRGIQPGDIANSKDSHQYIRISINRKRYFSHRLAWLYMTGNWPQAAIDHVNGVTHDNSWKNLREATNKQNQENKGLSKNNKSGYRGVCQKHNKWLAYVTHNSKQIWLGRFTTAEEAAQAAAAKRAELFTHDTGRDKVSIV